jgi:hypothetical protein
MWQVLPSNIVFVFMCIPSATLYTLSFNYVSVGKREGAIEERGENVLREVGEGGYVMLSVKGSILKLPLLTNRIVRLLGFNPNPTLIVTLAPTVVSLGPDGIPNAKETGPKVIFVE